MKNLQRLIAATLLITASLFATSCKEDNPPEIDRSIGITEAAIANNPLVVTQPVITEKTEGRSEIVFHVAAQTKPEQMKFALTFKIPAVCVSAPASGTEIDFLLGTVPYTVTNEQAKLTKTYDVKCIRDKYEDAAITSILIDNSGGKVVTQPVLVDGNYEFTVSETTTADEMKAFVPTIEISEGATISPKSGVAQDFTNPVVYTVTSESGHTSDYTVTCIKKLYEGAKILTMEFKGNALIAEQPVIPAVGGDIKFYVKPETTAENIKKLTPTITVSEGATVSPASDVEQDFTAPVVYTVTAQNGVENSYTVTCVRNKYEGNNIVSMTIDDNPLIDVQPTINYDDNSIVFHVFLAATPADIAAITPTIMVSPGATISPASGVATDFTTPVVYTVTSESGQAKTYSVRCVREKNNEALITSINFDFDKIVTQPTEVDGVFTFTVAPETTPEEIVALTPTITLSEGATVDPASDVAQDFTNPVTYTVTAENGVTTKTYTVTCVKNKYAESKIVSMTIENNLLIATQPTIKIEDNSIVFFLSPEATPADIAAITPTITLSEGATVDPASDVAQDFTNPVTYTVTAEDGVATSTYTVTCVRNKYTESKIVSMTIDGNPLIESQPVINSDDNTVVFVISLDATSADIAAITPTITLSPGATVDPASNVAQDFTNPVTYTVTAESGISTIYTVIARILQRGVMSYDFEPWKIIGAEGKSRGYDPGTLLAPTDIKSGDDPSEPHNNWGTSNPGLLTLIGMNRAESHAVFPADAPEGYTDRGAKLVTIKVKGGNMIIQKIPHVTAGSLYLGKFVLNMASPLKSTQFGIPVDYKPEYVTLYYKYAPGELFLRSTAANPHVIVEEAGTLDECAISVVLYEVASVDEASLDGTNIATATNIVAFAALEDGTAKANYTPLKLTLNYLKPYDFNKTYRLAIVASSSKGGDTFSGAPQYIEGGVITKVGSTLYVDEVNIHYVK